MGVEEVGVDGSNNPIEYTGETSRPSAAHDGNAAAAQIAAAETTAFNVCFLMFVFGFPLLLPLRADVWLVEVCVTGGDATGRVPPVLRLGRGRFTQRQSRSETVLRSSGTEPSFSLYTLHSTSTPLVA